MAEDKMDTSDNSSSIQDPQHTAQQTGLFQANQDPQLAQQTGPFQVNQDPQLAQQTGPFQVPQYHPHVHHILNQVPVAAQQVSVSIPTHLHPNLKHIENQIQLAVLQAAQPSHLPPDLSNILYQVQQAVMQAAASQPSEIQRSVFYIQNQLQLAALQTAAFQPVQNQHPQHAPLQAAAIQSTQAPPGLYPNMAQVQNQHPQQAPLLAAVVQSNPHSGDPPSTSNEGNHQDTISVSTVITTQPQSVPEKIPAKPSGRQNSQPDLYTEKGDHGATSDDGATMDDDATSRTGSDDARRSSASADTSEDLYTSGGAGAAGGAEPSAPRDSVKVNIRVEWKQKIPDRWDKHLHKALQKWTSTVLGKSCEVINLRLLDDPRCAEVEISPSEGCDVLKTITEQSLTFRDLRCSAPVHFLMVETKPVTEPQQSGASVEEKKGPVPEVRMDFNVHKLPMRTQTELKRRFGQTGNMLSFSGNFDTVEKKYREVQEIVGGSKSTMAAAKIPQQAEKSGDPNALTVPLPHYWYFSHAFSKDILQLEKKLGVRVNAEASVSVTAVNQNRSDSVQEATQIFTDLYQKHIHNLKSIEIPQTQLESELVKHVMQDVQSGKNKMMLNLSEDQYQLFGPEPVISTVQKQMNLGTHMEIDTPLSTNMLSRMKFNGASSSSSSQTPKPLEMDIKDALDPIEMNEALWKLIEKTSQEQLHNIETKYGVLLSPAPSQDKFKVTVTSNNPHVNLESHALRAFMHLYQKVATSAVACTIKHSAEEKTVQALKSCEDCFVRVQEKNSSLKLVGLPKRLGPAITEIEKLVGKTLFDDKTKKMIGYTENLPQSWGLRGGQPGAGAAQWTYRTSPDRETQAKNESRKAKTEKESDSDDCPICMDKFTDRRKLKCGHEFCRECLDLSVKNMGEICPVCKDIFGTLIGTQPDGTMDVSTRHLSLPGYPRCGTIEIVYRIPDGVQTERHPNPGKRFHGTSRQAYLPDNDEGRHVLKLLRRAFDQKLIFTVGTSTTSGLSDSVIWNDIHHKTTTAGGSSSYGYPDPDYLRRVKEELKAKGIE